MVKDDSKLHRNYDDKGIALFTRIPNALMNAIVRGQFRGVEMKIIMFIARRSYGFNREETSYLGWEDFNQAIGIEESHFSTQINGMLKRWIIFRAMKNGKLYKYAVNLLAYEFTMKHYKIVDKGYKLSAEDYTFDDKTYTFSNKSEIDCSAIVYNSVGYDKAEMLYIKNDRKIDTNLDIKDDSVDDASARSLGATCAEAVKSKSSTATKSTGASLNKATATSATARVFVRNGKKINLDVKDREAEVKAIASDTVERDKEEQRIKKEFKETMEQDSSPEMILDFMEQLKAIGVNPLNMMTMYINLKNKLLAKGVALDSDNYFKAEDMFNTKYKGFKAENMKGGMSITRIISFGDRKY